jgi:uncharacterized protein YuzE
MTAVADTSLLVVLGKGQRLDLVDSEVAGKVTEEGAVKILDKGEWVDWEYDGDADVLYLSIGKPQKAPGVDIGEGVVVPYDEKKREVVGLTIVGIRARLVELPRQT